MENENIKKKDTAKEKILLFIIGVLVGAIISTSAFFVYAKTIGSSNIDNSSSRQMPGGTPPEMQNNESNQNGTSPEKPDNQTNQNENQSETSSNNSPSQDNN